MTPLKLTKKIKPFWSLSLSLLIDRRSFIALIFAWIVSLPLSENPINFDYCNVDEHIQYGGSWIFFMINTTNNLSRPVTAPVTPAGLVMNPPLFLDDPVIPGINFLQNFPFLNQLPNFFPVQILTPPFFGGLGNLIGGGLLVPLATQLAHNVNPTIVPGAGFNAPPVLPTAFWPTPAPLITNPILDPNVTAGAASSHWPVIFLGSTTLILLATGWWAFYKKKAAPSEIAENISSVNAALGTGKPVKYSILPDDYRKNFNQLSSLQGDKTGGVVFLEIEFLPNFSVKVLGFPIQMSMIPFICLSPGLKETLTAVFCALLRKGLVYLVRQQITVFWKAFLFGKVKNAHLLFFATTLTKNLSKSRPHSQNSTLKTKIVKLYTAHQIALLLKKRYLNKPQRYRVKYLQPE